LFVEAETTPASRGKAEWFGTTTKEAKDQHTTASTISARASRAMPAQRIRLRRRRSGERDVTAVDGATLTRRKLAMAHDAEARSLPGERERPCPLLQLRSPRERNRSAATPERRPELTFLNSCYPSGGRFSTVSTARLSVSSFHPPDRTTQINNRRQETLQPFSCDASCNMT